MAAKVGATKPPVLRVCNIAAEAKVIVAFNNQFFLLTRFTSPHPTAPQDDALLRFFSDICPGRRFKCTLSRDPSHSPENPFLQTATLDLPDAESAEALLLHADGAEFMGRRLSVVDAAADASSAGSSKVSSASEAKKVRVACDLLPTANLDQLRDVMAVLGRLSQSDSDHVRQVLLSNPELSLSLVVAAERLQLLDQPLKHVEAPAPALHPVAAGAAAASAPAAAVGAYRLAPGSNAPPPPPPVNLPIEVLQALEMLLRECELLKMSVLFLS